MIATVDAFFFVKRTNDQRVADLRKFLDGYEQRINPDLLPEMLRCWNVWVQSNRVSYPFPNGRLQQPRWVLDWFEIFDAVSQLAELEDKRPTLAGLPSIDQVFGAAAQE